MELVSSMVDLIKLYDGDKFLITELLNGFPVNLPVPSVGGGLISVSSSGLGVISASRSGVSIYVRFELWDSAPEPLDRWTQLWEGELHIDSGSVSLAQYYSPEDGDDYKSFDLGRRGASWSVRLQKRKLTNKEEPDFPENIFEVEIYKVQFWSR